MVIGSEGRIPAVGDHVLYTLDGADADTINDRRVKGGPRFIGNSVTKGSRLPGVLVAVWGSAPDSCANVHILLDGYDSHWVGSRRQGSGAGEWEYNTG